MTLLFTLIQNTELLAPCDFLCPAVPDAIIVTCFQQVGVLSTVSRSLRPSKTGGLQSAAEGGLPFICHRVSISRIYRTPQE